MRHIKIFLLFVVAFVMIQLPMPSNEWGECYCVNYTDVFNSCNDHCGSEEECKGIVKQGIASCVGTMCNVAYYILCHDYQLNTLFHFEEPCDRNCPQVSEQ